MKLTEHLLNIDRDIYEQAERNQFLKEVGTLQIKPENLKAWLIQDRFYTGGYIKMMGLMISRLSLYEDQRELGDNDPFWSQEKAQNILRTLSFALSNVHRESEFFTDLLSREPYRHCKVPEQQRAWTTKYFEYVKRITLEGGHDLGEPLVALWLMEIMFYDAWSFAKSINNSLGEGKDGKDSQDVHIQTCHELMENWTLEEFKEFVDDCGSLVDALDISDPRRMASYEKVYKEVLALEVDFWNMAYNFDEK
ncbi:hypothetical protein BDF20DRAFT_909467 [Mycotypha africana]|uniref:uncharacterized protein n=1 Tax=Mycotypha africana TaxID=64632 RepID=UPI00230193BB|nr:uncharacterized protein BDF20DRAFT_909467 [Mycotypha africana]KAI8991730.1 hypothetical protein BDF20DRAFT_909467 [Mycotypha africana]